MKNSQKTKKFSERQKRNKAKSNQKIVEEKLEISIKVEIKKKRIEFLEELKVPNEIPKENSVEARCELRNRRNDAQQIEDKKRIELWKIADAIQEER